MHIEPGVVTGAKLMLSYATAAGALGIAARMAWQTISRDGGLIGMVPRSLLATLLVFGFFQVLPHHPVGVSEVHLILGSTLFLLFGAGPTAIGLAAGLLLQGLLFAPFDLPQYGMNVTTLLIPLWGIHVLAGRIIARGTRYTELTYTQALKLSTAYQGGIVAWVAFWAVYGQGLEHVASIASFGVAYMSVILVEPLIDLGVLATAKRLHRLSATPLFTRRLLNPA
ncbi:energy-coupling factor ABC transporter permease [Larsenimonas rhizosphaerae]|uniref:Energy-coupling factor ABC transporter permease n=1 Tax=Larsenimonas rhizosphaerae TaxID=2944682 RepID=A0AA41ZNN9_9GAMM|nr:energy-coupling factor ABC transporter permease [Larsenimonas rhizosphaerae]MCM2129622.1 energy-coupling factor ABC transporter permease [Larsenimonas rhizosphaerae]MCX2524280.1 energy-coupling factor ABC transporter permease [Larsenimonas rhizosphaerae]